MSVAHPDLLLYIFAALAIILIAIVLLQRGQRSMRNKAQKYTSLRFILRTLSVIALIIAAAEPFYEKHTETSDVLALVDISDSLDEGVADSLLRELSKFERDGAELKLIPFSGNAAPVPLAYDDVGSYRSLKQAWSKLDIGKTDLENALGQAISENSGSLLLISDGYETKGDFRAVLGQLKQSAMKLYPLVPADAASSSKFSISRLHAPLVAAAEKSVEIRVAVKNSSTDEREGILEVKHEGKSLYKEKVSIAAQSEKLFVVNSDPSKEGIKEVTATLTPIEKQFAPSSETIFISGAGREKVLLLSPDEESAYFLKQVLSDQAYRVKDISNPSQDITLPELSEFSTVILNNVARKFLPSDFPRKLEAYAKEGGGVTLIGGNQSFGLGGYVDTAVETISPLKFVPPQTEKKRLNVAVTLVLDKSHSMRDDNKISFVKDAARAVIQNLKNEDYVEVIGFDENPFIAVKMARLAENREVAMDRVDRLYPAGRTNPLPAMDEARRSMSQVQAGRKHVIIMTDGKIPQAGLYYIGIVNQLRAVGATVSTVLLGSETDTAQLKAIASAGGGSFYQTTDASSLPKIFVGDVKVSTGEKTQKENREFSVRRGTGDIQSTTLGSFPAVLGYVETRTKENANLELIAYADDRAEPLLARWNYQKGKVVAFTSDVNGRWSQRWVDWASFHRFWSEVIDSVRTAKEKAEESTRFDLRYYVEKGTLKLDLSLFSDDLQGAVVADLKLPSGASEKIEFAALSRGHYLASLPKIIPGKYELTTRVGDKKLTAVAFNISGELFGESKGEGFNLAELTALASATGGKLNPGVEELKSQVYIRKERRDCFQYFVLFAIACILFEILVRELRRIPFLYYLQRRKRVLVRSGSSSV